MNNKIEITKVLKNLDEYTEEELKTEMLYQTGFEYNGKIYYFDKPVICYPDMPRLFNYFMVKNGNKADSYTTYMYKQYKKALDEINMDYQLNAFDGKPIFDKILKDEINYTKKEEKVVKKELQQAKAYDTKVNLVMVFKNKKSYTDNDWVKGHQLLVGLEYNGKRYPFSKEIIAPDDISKFLKKVRNDVSKNKGVKLEIDAYNEIVDVVQKITNEYGGFGGKTLLLKILDNEVEYSIKEDERIIISKKQNIESSDNELSGLEIAVIGTSLAGFSAISLASSAEDEKLFWIPVSFTAAPFFLTYDTTENGGNLVELIVYRDSNGNVRIKKAGSSIAINNDKIEQNAEYIYSKLNKKHRNENKEKGLIIADSQSTANGLLNILNSYSKEELLIKVKALEKVLKERQEELLKNNEGFQRTI